MATCSATWSGSSATRTTGLLSARRAARAASRGSRRGSGPGAPSRRPPSCTSMVLSAEVASTFFCGFEAWLVNGCSPPPSPPQKKTQKTTVVGWDLCRYVLQEMVLFPASQAMASACWPGVCELSSSAESCRGGMAAGRSAPSTTKTGGTGGVTARPEKEKRAAGAGRGAGRSVGIPREIRPI